MYIYIYIYIISNIVWSFNLTSLDGTKMNSLALGILYTATLTSSGGGCGNKKTNKQVISLNERLNYADWSGLSTDHCTD